MDGDQIRRPPDESGPKALSDRDAVTRLLGREPAGAFEVVVRRRNRSPVVIENAPLLDDGRPMPTRFWLVDRELRDAVSRLEAAGGVRMASNSVASADIDDAHARYASQRDRVLPADHVGPKPSGGVGGTRQGVKCLHAHLAWHLAGGNDPVGEWTAAELAVDPSEFVGPAAADAQPAQPVAAVDCGSNSTRLIVVDAEDVVIDRQMRITRLGEGVDAAGALAPAAINRTLSVLRIYRDTMRRHGVGLRRVAATSAVRDSANADEFLDAAASIVGVRPEILSGEEEGRLSFAGATARLPEGAAGAAPVLVVDIGGGSTELTVGQLSGACAPVSRSLDVGCVRVAERFLRHDPPLRREMETARLAVERLVSEAASSLPVLAADSLLVGLAGTVSTLTCLVHEIAEYERSKIHHSVIERRQVVEWLERLASEDAAARLARPGMDPGREDVIVGGVLVLDVVMSVFGLERCLVSEDDILDGLAAELLRPDPSTSDAATV